MKYFIDTEFIEDGPSVPLRLISLGIVAEDGREFYAENFNLSVDEISDYPWLKENVVPHLLRGDSRLPYNDIGPAVLKFIGDDKEPQFWGYCADYDWVLFAQLFGTMVKLPRYFPHMCLDLRQEMKRLRVSKVEIPNEGALHNALADARWTRRLFQHLYVNYPDDLGAY
jgi:hypothetical protein